MAGTLKVHPFSKTYDESQRAIKRLSSYLDINFTLLPDEEKERINRMVESLENVIRFIPEEYQLTMHQQYTKKN